MEISAILCGVAAGVTYSLTSFAKKEGQAFEWKKFGTTRIIGGGAGAMTGLLGMQIDLAYAYLINMGIVPIVENLLKFVYRKIIKRFVK